jgi:hypothetical protein
MQKCSMSGVELATGHSGLELATGPYRQKQHQQIIVRNLTRGNSISLYHLQVGRQP